MNLEPEAALLKNSKYTRFASDVRGHLADIDKSLTATRSDSNAQVVSSRLRSLQHCLEEHREYLDVPEKAAVLRCLQACLVDCQSAGVHKQATQILEHMIKIMGPNLSKSLPLFLVSLLCRLPQAASEAVVQMRDLLKAVIQKTPGNVLKPCVEGMITGLLPALEQTATGDDKESMKILDALLVKLINDCQKPPTAASGGAATASSSSTAAAGNTNTQLQASQIQQQRDGSSSLFDRHNASPAPTEGVRVFFRALWYAIANDATLRPNALVFLSQRVFRDVPALTTAATPQMPGAPKETALATAEQLQHAYLGDDPQLAVRALCIAALDPRENTQQKLLELLLRHLPLDGGILSRNQKVEVLSRVLFIATTNRNAMLMRLIRWVYGGNTELEEAVQFFKRVSSELVSEALELMVRRCITQREAEVVKLAGKAKAFATSGAVHSGQVMSTSAPHLLLMASGSVQHTQAALATIGRGASAAAASAGGAGGGGGGDRVRPAPHVFQVIVALLQREESVHTFQTLLPTLGPVISDWITSNLISGSGDGAGGNGNNGNNNMRFGSFRTRTQLIQQQQATWRYAKPPIVSNYVKAITAQVLDVVPVELFLDCIIGQVHTVAVSAVDGTGNQLGIVGSAETVLRKLELALDVVGIFLDTSASASGSMVTSSSATINRNSVKALINCARQAALLATALVAVCDVQGRGGSALHVVEMAVDLCWALAFRIAPAVQRPNHRRAIVAGVLAETTQLFQVCLAMFIEQQTTFVLGLGESSASRVGELAAATEGLHGDMQKILESTCSSSQQQQEQTHAGMSDSEVASAQVKLITLFTKLLPALQILVSNEEDAATTAAAAATAIAADPANGLSTAAAAAAGSTTTSMGDFTVSGSTATSPPTPSQHQQQHNSPTGIHLEDAAAILGRVRAMVIFALGGSRQQQQTDQKQQQQQQQPPEQKLGLEATVALSRCWLVAVEHSGCGAEMLQKRQRQQQPKQDQHQQEDAGVNEKATDVVLRTLWTVFHPTAQTLHNDATDIFLPLSRVRSGTALDLVNQPLDADHARRCTMILGEVSAALSRTNNSANSASADANDSDGGRNGSIPGAGVPLWVSEALFIVSSVTEVPFEACPVEHRAARGVCETWLRQHVPRSLLFIARPAIAGLVKAVHEIRDTANPSDAAEARFASYVRQLRGLLVCASSDLVRHALSHEFSQKNEPHQHQAVNQLVRECRSVIGDFFPGLASSGSSSSSSSSSSTSSSSSVLSVLAMMTGIALHTACSPATKPQPTSSSSSSSSSDIRSLTSSLKGTLSSAVHGGSTAASSLPTAPMPPVVLDCVRLLLDALKNTVRWAPVGSQLQGTIPIVASLVHMLLWVLRQCLEKSWADMIPSVVGTATLGLDFLFRNNAFDSDAVPSSSATAESYVLVDTPLSPAGPGASSSSAGASAGGSSAAAGGASGAGGVSTTSSGAAPVAAAAAAAAGGSVLWKLVAIGIESASALFYAAVVYEMVGTFSGLGVVQVAGDFVLNLLRWSGPLLPVAAESFVEVNEMIICLSMNAPLNPVNAFALRVASDNLQGVISAALRLQEVMTKKTAEAAREASKDTGSIFGGGLAFGGAMTASSGSKAAEVSSVRAVPRQALQDAMQKLRARVTSIADIAIAVESFLEVSRKVPARARHVQPVHGSIQSLVELCLQLSDAGVVERICNALIPPNSLTQVSEAFRYAMMATVTVPPQQQQPASSPSAAAASTGAGNGSSAVPASPAGLGASGVGFSSVNATGGGGAAAGANGIGGVDSYSAASSAALSTKDLMAPARLLLGSGTLLPGQFVKLVTENIFRRRARLGQAAGGGGQPVQDPEADFYAAYAILMYVYELFSAVDSASTDVSPVFGAASSLQELRASVLIFISGLAASSSSLAAAAVAAEGAAGGAAASSAAAGGGGGAGGFSLGSNAGGGGGSAEGFFPFTVPLLIRLLDITLARCHVPHSGVENTSTSLVADAVNVITFSKEGIRVADLFARLLTLCMGSVPQVTPSSLRSEVESLSDAAAQVSVRIFAKDPERLGKLVATLAKENLATQVDAAQASDVRLPLWWAASVVRALLVATSIAKPPEGQQLALRAAVTDLLFKEGFFNCGRDALGVFSDIVSEISQCITTFNQFVLKCGERPRFRLTSAQHAQECEARARGLKRLAFFLYSSRLGTRELYTRLPQVRELVADTLRIANKREEECPQQTNEAMRMAAFVLRVLLYKVPPEHTKLLQGMWTLLFPESLRLLHGFVSRHGHAAAASGNNSGKEAKATSAAEKLMLSEFIKLLDFANVLSPSDVASLRWMFVDAHAARTSASFQPVCNAGVVRYRPNSSLHHYLPSSASSTTVKGAPSFPPSSSAPPGRAARAPARPRNACRALDVSISEFDGSDATPLRPLFALPPQQCPNTNEALLNMCAAFGQYIEQAEDASPLDIFVAPQGGGSDDDGNNTNNASIGTLTFMDEDTRRKQMGAGFWKREDGVDLDYVDWLLESDFLDGYSGELVVSVQNFSGSLGEENAFAPANGKVSIQSPLFGNALVSPPLKAQSPVSAVTPKSVAAASAGGGGGGSAAATPANASGSSPAPPPPPAQQTSRKQQQEKDDEESEDTKLVASVLGANAVKNQAAAAAAAAASAPATQPVKPPLAAAVAETEKPDAVAAAAEPQDQNEQQKEVHVDPAPSISAETRGAAEKEDAAAEKQHAEVTGEEPMARSGAVLSDDI